MTKRIYFTIATKNYDNDYQNLEKSFRKFHPNDELIRFSDDSIPNDPEFFFRATPYFAKQLFYKGYTEVCHLDADQIILDSLEGIWEGDFDVATVLNSPALPLRIWDIGVYYNNGLNVFKNKEFVEHWLKLCHTPHFQNYQYREQDLLTILCSDYFNYKVRCLDLDDKIYGELAKPLWAQAVVEGDKVMIQGKQLVVVHFGGGASDPSKGNFRIRFQEPVVKLIERLIK